MSMKKLVSLLAAVTLLVTIFSGCSGSTQAIDGSVEKKTIVFGDAGWDSIKFHNAVAMFIVETAFGYPTEELSGTTAVTYKALIDGDIDAFMEIWTDNLATYKDDVAKGDILELGVNFDDNKQGLYVPRYVIEGDSERGIAPMAPDLKTVADLAKYKDVFVDPEDKSKGRIYGSIPGWEVDTILYNKFLSYNLDKNFNYFRPGSDSALAAMFTSAYEKGEAIVGYYWEPAWLTGKYDLVLLGDTPYNKDTCAEGIGAFPSVRVTVCATKSLPQTAPGVVEFLKKYKTTSALTAEALAYLSDNKADYTTTAKWFLKEHGTLLDDWLTPDQAALVRKALEK